MLDLVGCREEERIAVEFCVERLDRPGHGGVSLACRLGQPARIDFEVGDRERECRIPWFGRWRASEGDAGAVCPAIAADDLSIPAVDGAESVEDGEDRDECPIHVPNRRPLAAGLCHREVNCLAHGGVAPGAPPPEREPSRRCRFEGGPAQPNVRVDPVLTGAEVEDDRSGNQRHVHPVDMLVAPPVEERGSHAG